MIPRTKEGFWKLTALAILFAVIVAALGSVMEPRSARSQLSAQQTWVPASGVGGGANAVTLAIANINSLADLLGAPIRFLPTNVNAAGGTTINPTSLGAIAVKRASAGALVPIAGGDFTTGTMVEVVYDGTQFVQTNPATGTAPVGSEIAVLAGTAAIAGYLIENGTCISQTTYSALFAFFGSTDVWTPGSTGGACSAGNFHLPYANGRNAAAADTQGGVTANVLTNAGSGCVATGVAGSCGAQNKQVLTANLPNITLNTSVPGGEGSHLHAYNLKVNGTAALGTGGNSVIVPNSGSGTPLTDVSATLPALTGTTPLGGNGDAVVVQNPTYTVLKMIKY